MFLDTIDYSTTHTHTHTHTCTHGHACTTKLQRLKVLSVGLRSSRAIDLNFWLKEKQWHTTLNYTSEIQLTSHHTHTQTYTLPHERVGGNSYVVGAQVQNDFLQPCATLNTLSVTWPFQNHTNVAACLLAVTPIAITILHYSGAYFLSNSCIKCQKIHMPKPMSNHKINTI